MTVNQQIQSFFLLPSPGFCVFLEEFPKVFVYLFVLRYFQGFYHLFILKYRVNFSLLIELLKAQLIVSILSFIFLISIAACNCISVLIVSIQAFCEVRNIERASTYCQNICIYAKLIDLKEIAFTLKILMFAAFY